MESTTTFLSTDSGAVELFDPITDTRWRLAVSAFRPAGGSPRQAEAVFVQRFVKGGIVSSAAVEMDS